MTKNTFRQYRVLGKGGFGEVSWRPFSPVPPTRGTACVPVTGSPSWLSSGVRLSGTSHRQNVRLQEAGEEEDQEEERRVHGAEREADPGEGQQQIRGKTPQL